jgi:hypothetical protein
LQSAESRAAILGINVLLIVIFADCLIFFLSYSESSSPAEKWHKFQIGYPTSPWLQFEKYTNLDAEKHAVTGGGYDFRVIWTSWSWAIAAGGALAIWLVGKVNRVEEEMHSRLFKMILNGIWPLIVLFSFTLALTRAAVIITYN